MCLVCVEHHLLISPLGSELCIGRVIIGIWSVHLTLSRVHRIRLLVMILVEGGIKVLRAVWGGVPGSLLLLNGIRIWLLLRDGRRSVGDLSID